MSVHPDSTIKQDKLLINTNWMTLRSITLSERSQCQKVTYYMIPCVRHSWKDKTVQIRAHRDMNQGKDVTAKGKHEGLLRCDGILCSIFWLWWWLHKFTSANIHRTIYPRPQKGQFYFMIVLKIKQFLKISIPPKPINYSSP